MHEVLSLHPDVYLSPAKDLYFFSRYHDRGVDWYAEQFSGARAGHAVVGEVCPDYLMTPAAPRRIAEVLGPDVRVMVSLRDPVDRAFSSFLYLQRHGMAARTFQDTARQHPELLEEGRYGTLLRHYAAHLGPDRILVTTFDELRENPQGYLDDVTAWLEIAPFRLDEVLAEPVLPASRARFVPLAAVARRAADVARRHDGADLVGRVKRSRFVDTLLYRPLGDDRPRPSDRDVEYVRDRLAGELGIVDRDFGVALPALWGWR